MKIPERLKREGRFLSFNQSVNLPSNLLSQMTSVRAYKASTADPYRHSATLDVTSNKFHSFTAQVGQRRVVHQHTNSDKKWIVEKKAPQKSESLSKRLRNMRLENDVLQSFSLSKLLSKIKVLKDSEQRYEQLATASPTKKTKTNKIIRPRLFKFKQQEDPYDVPVKQTESHRHNQSSHSSPRKSQDEQSSKIFKRFFCPPSSYRDPSFFRQITPDDKYIYKDGKKVQCKRIHNFYTSHMYRRGYAKHFQKIEEEQTLEPPIQLGRTLF